MLWDVLMCDHQREKRKDYWWSQDHRPHNSLGVHASDTFLAEKNHFIITCFSFSLPWPHVNLLRMPKNASEPLRCRLFLCFVFPFMHSAKSSSNLFTKFSFCASQNKRNFVRREVLRRSALPSLLSFTAMHFLWLLKQEIVEAFDERVLLSGANKWPKQKHVNRYLGPYSDFTRGCNSWSIGMLRMF